MKKIVRTTLALSIALALTACNNDNNDPTPTSLDISGAAIKGSLAAATVNVYAASDAERATVLATSQTDANGDYSVQVVDASGAEIIGTFVVEVLADEDTTMICDATLCGDVARGESIPASELVGLSLSTITYSDGTAISADVNSLTTMATDTILSSAAIEGSAIDLATISAADFLEVQNDTSEIIGAILGVDLSATNIFAIDIVDASVSADVSVEDSITATLTLINASLTSLDVADGSTLSAAINDYVNAVETVTAALLADPDVDLGTAASEALATINATQAQISDEVTMISAEITSDTGVKVPTEEIPTELDEDALADTVGDIIDGTGGTGATGGEG